MLTKRINLQLFADSESTGVNSHVAAGQEGTSQETPHATTQETEPQQTQENSGVETQPAAGANEGVEKAFAARLSKEREKLEAELRQRLEAELRQRYESELKNNPHLSYLEQKAKKLGITVEQLIENDRKWEEQQALNELIQKNIPEEYARKLLEHDKIMQEYLTEKQQKEKKEKEQQMYLEFLETYPDIKPEEIPAEVWQEVDKGRNLLDAYVRYENQKLKAEMAKFQQQQQTKVANEKNAASSTGSVKSPEVTGDFISREQFDANKHDINWVRKNLKHIEESRKHWK